MAGADMDLAASESGIFLDTTSFRHFAPLLEASQAYAQLSGCRFRLASFGPGHPLPAPSEGQPSRDKSLRLAAKVQAEPQVQVFSERLLAGDPQLTEELDRAFRVVMVEGLHWAREDLQGQCGVRNAMMAAFQRLELWPPRPAPEGIEEDDCCYEDVNSPLPVIAQRLYNDDVRRLMAVPCDGAASPWQQRALTAAFIVDFAEEVGLPCLSMPPTQQEMIEEFALRAKAKDGKKDEKAKPKAKAAPTKPETKTDDKVRTGKDGGASALAKLRSFSGCVLAEYVWLDADGVTRSKTMTMTARPLKVTDLKVWNYDGSSTGQADGHNSEVLLKPRAIFNDPFRGYPNVMVLADAWNAWDDQPAKNNTRAPCAEIMDRYRSLDPWFGIEQEYTLMKPGKVGLKPTVPLGFNADGSEPAPQGPYYTGAGFNVAIGRPVADEHYKLCMEAGVKISGINAEVMPGQWEFQIGPCRGIEMGDHLTMARYIMLRVTEKHDCVCSFEPKPAKGDWNGAGCHTNFSVTPMRVAGGYDTIIKVCEAFGKVAKEHIAEYGVANRGASIRIPREAEKSGRGYMEDRRPGANCDPYRVTKIIMKTTGECLSAETIEAGGKTHTAFVFIKPHANNEKVQTLVKEKLTSEGLTIKSEGTIKSTVIDARPNASSWKDKKKLIDTHYGAIAAKAVTMKPKDLTVQEKSQEEFEKQFGVKWSKVMEDGLVFNAMDGAKKLGITADELGKKWMTSMSSTAST
eukprot:g16855.t1